MANAIRKRIALAAVAALGAGVLTAAPASAAQSIAFAQDPIRAGEATTIAVTLGEGAAAGDFVKLRIDSAPTGGYTYNTALKTGGDVVSSSALAADDTEAFIDFYTTAGANGAGKAAFTTAGTYAVTLWLGNNDSTLDPGEAYTSGSIVVGGAPTAIALSAASSSVVVGTTVKIFTTSATDAAGRATELTGAEQLNIVSTRTSATGTYSASTSQAALGAFTVTGLIATDAGTYTLTVSPGGSLPGSITAKTHTLTVLAAGATAPTDLATSLATNIVKGGVAGARTATVNTSVKTFDVTASGATASKPVVIYVSNAGGTAATGVTVAGISVTAGNEGSGAPVFVGTANADGKVTFTVTTTDTSLNGNKLRLANNVNAVAGEHLTFTWTSPAFDDSESEIDNIAVVGAAVSLTIAVKDQYGNAGAGYLVSAQTDVTTAGTGGPVVGTKGTVASGVTSAAGSVTLTVAAPAGTVNGTIANVLYTVTNSTATSTLASAVTAFAVTYVTEGALTSLALTANDFDADGVDVAAGQTIAVPAAFTMQGAAGANTAAAAGDNYIKFEMAASAAAIVTVTGSSNNVWFSTTAPTAWDGGKNSVTAGSASAVYVWATKTGTHSVTITAGGKTATGYFKVTTAAGTARNIALSMPTEAGNGKVAVATVTVTDVFGNPMVTAGLVKVSITGPAFINGSLTETVIDTGTDGTAKVSVVTAAAGTGDIVVTATGTGAQFAAKAARLTSASVADDAAGFTASTSPASATAKLVAEKTAAETAAEKAAADAAKAVAAVTAVQTTITAIQTAISTLVASFTSTLLILQNRINQIAKKLGLK